MPSALADGKKAKINLVLTKNQDYKCSAKAKFVVIPFIRQLKLTAMNFSKLKLTAMNFSKYPKLYSASIIK